MIDKNCFYCNMQIPVLRDPTRAIFHWHLQGHKDGSEESWESKFDNKFAILELDPETRGLSNDIKQFISTEVVVSTEDINKRIDYFLDTQLPYYIASGKVNERQLPDFIWLVERIKETIK